MSLHTRSTLIVPSCFSSCSPRPIQSYSSSRRHTSTPLAHNLIKSPKLDPLLTPVWYRRLPPYPATPLSRPRSMAATTQHPTAVPSTERTSPSLFESSLTPPQSDGPIARRTRSRERRSPSRLPLRYGFRTFSGVATVLVGEANNKARPETKYLVHKELITSASPFFAAALNSTFAEGMDQTVKLPEEKPEIFEWFLQWLYTGTLKTPAPRCHFITNGVTTVPVLPSMHSLT